MDDDRRFHDDTNDRGADAGKQTQAEAREESGALDEVDILRSELRAASERLAVLESEYQACHDKLLRARADLENTRRRHLNELERAREAGLDAAVLPVLAVYDDLGRALQAAESGDDPSGIVPGVRSVRDALERSLASLGINRVGDVGEAFDPDHHEAIAVVPARGDRDPGAIAEVFEAGFVRGERLVRPARVVVVEPD